jgi:predicted nuclease with RNAse H fold
MTWFGADPGGKDAFGVALLEPNGSFRSSVVSCADEAVSWLKRTDACILAAGVDAPLWWSSGMSGDRKVDKFLRERFHISGGTVQPANSLRGAVLIQGVMLAIRLRKCFPSLAITESHPKALLKALKVDKNDQRALWATISEQFILKGEAPRTEHETDALLGAVAAREGSACAWTVDLAKRERETCEQDNASLPWGPVCYWWPDDKYVEQLKNHSRIVAPRAARGQGDPPWL